MRTLSRRTLIRLATAASAMTAPWARAGELHGIDSMTLLAPPQPMAAFAFRAADGTEHRLGEFAGRGVLLNLWATWCAPCVAEMPALDALAARLAGATAPIAVLPVAMDRGGATAVRAFYDSHRLGHLPVWLDSEAEALTAFKLSGIPTTFLLDAKGLVRARWEGPVDWSAADVPEQLPRLLT